MEPVVSVEPIQIGSIFLAMVGLFILFSIALSGWCMRFASRLCDGLEAGYLRSIFAVIVSALLGSGAAILTILLQPGTPQSLTMLYGACGSILGIALVMRQNPVRAVGTYIVFSVVGIFSHVGLALVVILLLCFTVPAAKLKELSQQASALQKSADTESRGKLDKWLASATSQQLKQDEQHSNVKKVPSVEGVSSNPFVQ